MITIEEILFTAVKSIGSILGLPIKWPNRNGPEGASVWLEVIHIPNGVARAGWSDLKANQGILNIGVHVPPDTGSDDAADALNEILTVFAQNTVLRDPSETMHVEIYMPPSSGQLIEDGQKAFYPVSVFYRSFED